MIAYCFKHVKNLIVILLSLGKSKNSSKFNFAKNNEYFLQKKKKKQTFFNSLFNNSLHN